MDQWWSDRSIPSSPTANVNHNYILRYNYSDKKLLSVEHGVSMDTTSPLCLCIHSVLHTLGIRRSCEGRLPRLAPSGRFEKALGPIGTSVWPGLEPLFGVLPYCYSIKALCSTGIYSILIYIIILYEQDKYNWACREDKNIQIESIDIDTNRHT